MTEKKTVKPTRSKGPAAGTKGGRQSDSKTSAREATAAGAVSWWEASAQFLREVKTELKKVTWPSRKQAATTTGVVLVLVAVVAVYLGIVDFILARLVRLVLG